VGQAPGEFVVRLAGEAGVGHARRLAMELAGVSVHRPSLVTLNLASLEAISSLVMGVLEAFRRGIVRAGGRVRLEAALTGPVRAAMERAGLLALLC
jgi:hypothetical protein